MGMVCAKDNKTHRPMLTITQ